MALPSNSGAFVPTTSVWDVSEIYSIDVTSNEFKELLVRLHQHMNNIALSLNIRDAGYYVEEEFVNGQIFFPNPTLSSSTSQTPTFRQVFRKVINFGSLLDNAAKSIAHGLTITNAFSFTRIYGCASDTTSNSYIPIPYVSIVTSNIIEISVDSTNVTITTGSDRTSYDKTYAILEYIKE